MTGTFLFFESSLEEVSNLTAPGKKFWDGEMEWFIVNRFFGPEPCYEGRRGAWRVKMQVEAL
jgi:hypothetical protein